MRAPQFDRIERIARDGYDSRGAIEVERTRSLIKHTHFRHAPCRFPRTHQPALTKIISEHTRHCPPQPFDTPRRAHQ